MKDAINKVSPINKGAILGRLGKVGSGINLFYKAFFKDESDANTLYVAILPSLKRTIKTQGYDAKESKALIELLIKSAPYGAKRRNFEKRYFGSPSDWKKLPDDPSDIPFGYWY